MLPNEPEGWSYLQGMAKRESDPNRLVEIIDQMNRLLDEHERRTGGAMRTKKHPSAREVEVRQKTGIHSSGIGE